MKLWKPCNFLCVERSVCCMRIALQKMIMFWDLELELWLVQVDQFSSVQFSRSVVSDSLLPHESQHARPPCPSPTPGVHSDSRP